MSTRKNFNLELDYFLDISQQIAFKRYIHKKFWNVVLHNVTSTIIVWSAFFFTSYVLPSLLMHVLLLFILLLCIKQDLLLGLASCLVYPVLYYHALYVTQCTFISGVVWLILTLCLQHFVGQQWIEDANALSLIEKSAEPSFLLIDILNESFFCLFHNGCALIVRLDRRRDLLDSSNIVLRRFIDRMKKVP